MAILTEGGNEYEVQIVNAVTGQSFEEYIMLGDQKIHGDGETERYITAYPGIMFKIQITLKAGFCFQQFDAVEANLYFKGQSTYCGLAVLNDPNPDHARTKQDLRMEIGCVNMSNYGENVIGAPFVFKELKIDETLSGQTDIIGVNPIDLGSFFVRLNRRRISPIPNNYLSKNTTTALWNAEKVDKSSFKEQGITNSIGLGQNRIATKESVVSSYEFTTSDPLKFHFTYRNFGFLSRPDVDPSPLYHSPWKSLTDIERRCALRELQIFCRSRREFSPGFERESKEWLPWSDMQPSERETKEQRKFERGVIKRYFRVLPDNRSIIPDEDGTAQQSAHPRELAKIKPKSQGPPNAIKQEMKLPNKVLTRNSNCKITGKQRMKEEHPHLGHAEVASGEPLAKRRKIAQEPIDADTTNNATTRQETIGSGILDEKAMIISKKTGMNKDLIELVDAVVLLEPSTPNANPEDSIYLEMAEEILRQTAAEFVRIRG
ncbi:uncharacterized protein EAE98_006673 [Botrytis deweyae]|uniref:DUF7918 domain-containing protein n=1 Tax=Botrytis deweyae TaxID=2478750 RepID=A0ABQ7IK73_9HELO|nr:uncharacterized protein EAE98_006673 [Botrytis deweyae]KAF7926378.1 hypothetical protein EAE98_006673 [Botrytis deweyae]